MLTVVSTNGCYQRNPWPPCVLEVTPECLDNASGGGSGSSGAGLEATSLGSIMTTTWDEMPTGGETTGTASGGSGTEATSESGEISPPTIGDMTLMPNLLTSAGIITVEVEVEDADEVSIMVDSGELVALTPVEAGGTLFTGEVVVFGESWNGEHEVTAVAARGEETSEPRSEWFTVVAPPAGGEAWLEKSPLVPSYGNAVDVDDQGDVLELFTHPTPQGQECFLRRRNSAGQSTWFGGAKWIAQGEDCVGEDVKFAPDGTIWVLVNVYTNTFGRWQLWHLDEGGMPLGQTPQVGSLTHMGRGLDVNAAGDVLLCGTRPETQTDDDAWVRFQPVGDGSWTEPWDYVAPNEPDEEHRFNEGTQDCAFIEDRIVVVGEVWGKHEKGNPEGLNRGFAVEFSVAGVKLAEVVNSAALAWHSGHQAVAPDGKGGYVAVGYNCGAMVTPCNDTVGALRWFSLGATEDRMEPVTNARRVYDVARSSAGYAVVAAKGLQSDQGFLVQGWSADMGDPVLEYQGGKTKLQVATGIAVDRVGFILAGGYFQEADDTLVAGVVMLNPY